MMEEEVLPTSTPEETSVPFWQKLDRKQLDDLYIRHFADKQSKEAALFRTKWFDYRFDHPLLSTYRFSHAYTQAYRYMTAIRFDVEKAKYVQGFSGKDGDFLKIRGAGKAGFLRARMLADHYGIPYDFWCRECMRFAEDNSWTNMPRPAQLYSPEMINHIIVRWEREQQVSPRYAENEAYLVENFAECVDQVQYQHYLINIITRNKSRMTQAMAVATLLDKLHPTSLQIFDEQTLREAERLRQLFSQH